MRLFFDSNVITLICYFEGYIIEGTDEEKSECLRFYSLLKKHDLTNARNIDEENNNKAILDAIEAIKYLYQIDEQAHFDWLCSDVAVNEIMEIKGTIEKEIIRENHYDFLERIIEQRNIIIDEQGLEFSGKMNQVFSSFSEKDYNDCIQCSEAIEYESDYFITFDKKFISKCKDINGITVTNIIELPFLK